jgi:hypothetical protein
MDQIGESGQGTGDWNRGLEKGGIKNPSYMMDLVQGVRRRLNTVKEHSEDFPLLWKALAATARR